MILALDTSTRTASIAIYGGGEGVVSELTWRSSSHHTVELAPYLDLLLRQIPKGLAGIAVALGPGSFTGLRVGLSFAKGLAMADRAAVVPVGTLDALAHQLVEALERSEGKPELGTRFCPLTTARRGEAFGRLFVITDAGLEPASEPFLTGAGELAEHLKCADIKGVASLSTGEDDISTTTCIGGEGADAMAADLNIPRPVSGGKGSGGQLLNHTQNGKIIYLPDVQASAESVGRMGLTRWRKEGDRLSPARKLEPLYLKEFTVKFEVR